MGGRERCVLIATTAYDSWQFYNPLFLEYRKHGHPLRIRGASSNSMTAVNITWLVMVYPRINLWNDSETLKQSNLFNQQTLKTLIWPRRIFQPARWFRTPVKPGD